MKRTKITSRKSNPIKKLEDFKISELLNFQVPLDIRKKLEKAGLEWTNINGRLDSVSYLLPSAKHKLVEALMEFKRVFDELDPTK